MLKKYTAMLALVLSVVVFLPETLFAQGEVVGYAHGKDYIGNTWFQYTLNTFPPNEQLDRLTQVIASDIGCYEDGRIFTGKLPDLWVSSSPPGDIWNGNQNSWLASLVSRAHARGVKVSICIGGGSTFMQATGSTNLNTFVNNIVNFVNVHGLDGVDINWEYPNTSDEWDQCIELLQSLRNELPTRRITIALMASQ